MTENVQKWGRGGKATTRKVARTVDSKSEHINNHLKC